MIYPETALAIGMALIWIPLPIYFLIKLGKE